MNSANTEIPLVDGVITSFSGANNFLSNFFRCEMAIGGFTMPTLEHWFVIRKVGTLKEFLDEAARVTGKRICTFDLQQMTPGKMKRIGRKVALRSDWEEVKFNVVTGLLRVKFSDPFLRKSLLLTGSHFLEEGNTWHDQIWGVCYCGKCERMEGKNHLGRLLMEVRAELSREGF